MSGKTRHPAGALTLDANDVRRINVDPLDHKQVHAMVYDIMNDSQRKAYEETFKPTEEDIDNGMEHQQNAMSRWNNVSAHYFALDRSG